MTPDELLRAIAKGRIAPVYFFTGTEVQPKLAAVEALIALVPEAVRAFNVQVFHAFEDELVDVLTAARTLPFMAERRLVVVRDIEKTRLDQAGRGELLEEYLAAPEPLTVLVVTTEDGERAKTLGKRHGGNWVQVEFRALSGEALQRAAVAEAARLGCTIDAAAAGALIETVGEDRARVFGELEKLRLAVGAGGAIDAAAVSRYAAGYVHHGALDIADAVGRRDLAGSLRLIGEVSFKDDQEFLGLLGMIGKRLRALWFLADGGRELPGEFRVWPSELEKLRRDARRFTRAEIERGLRELSRLDDAVKSTDVAPKLLLDHFLLGFLPPRDPIG